ncbi:putative ABC transporter ATP-binding protein yhcG [Fibrella aestuarina BUZ 2]|uniref:Putative ABC transporter ATP-binding protein yhcG n=1 Tax=Fibrella aestuarina BUZ 2 TaxID=1166018 RepID=I0KBU6_9BACT|nr:ABC transporter ATP-binding protein [Fibrella aestuarina]CCH01599.1 putative ABC transporter ATP-binding protein yhcG [Fibrella aestuarina BUZ 2]
MATIELTNLTFRYGRKPPVLRHLSLQLEPGHIYGLLGSNGAGKSSLLRLMAGLLYPTEGQLRVNTHDPRHRSPAFLEDVFLLPEETDTPSMTLDTYVRTLSAFYPKFSQEQFQTYLRTFQLPETIGKLNALSLGQRKKVFISFGLATNTSVLLMDEPTNGLDIPSKTQFRKVVSAALAPDRLVLISTHQVRDLDALIDAVVVLNDHEMLLAAPLERVGQRLRFERLAETVPARLPADVLYAEPGLRGQLVVRENDDPTDDTPVDLERLFNAAVNNPQRIKRLFSTQLP